MSVRVQFVEGPIRPALEGPGPIGTGAALAFRGVVRPMEADAPIVALEYTAYQPMASRLLQRLAEQTLARHGLHAIEVLHSLGRVDAGEVSFVLRVYAAHRAEALAAAADFIEQMKRDVPIWKRALPAPAPI